MVRQNESNQLPLHVARILRDAGFQVYYVGGYVRDGLLGRPLHDCDITTDARPADLYTLFPDAEEVGAHFGVVLIRGGGEEVQVATFRTETSYRDGRHPEAVHFETDPRADVLRRDFTINALLQNPFTDEVIDYTGGQTDLRNGIIRAIGDPSERFREDHLRMLRAVRFAAGLGFTIEPGTLSSIKSMAAAIDRISAERIRDEISRILTEGAARRGFELLDESGLLAVIFPEVARMKGVQQPPDFHPEGDVWIHTLGLLDQLSAPPLDLALAALLHDVGKPPTQTFEDRIRFSGHERVGAQMTREILSRLRYPNETIDAVESMVAQHMKFKNAPCMTDATFKRFVRQERFDTLLELHRIDLIASMRPLTNYEVVRTRREGMQEEDLRPEPLLRGRDLLSLGYEPGPRFSRVLHELEEEQLDGRISTRDQAIEFVRQAWERAST